MTRHHIINGYLDIDKSLCTACGECVEVCAQEVLELVDIKFIINHHHVKVVKPEECIGCFSCVDACPENAIQQIV